MLHRINKTWNFLVGNEKNSAESYSKVVGISNVSGSSSGGAGGAGGVSNKREANEGHKIEQNLIIEDLKDDESSAFVILKNENKEFENAPKNETNDQIITKTELKDKKTLLDLVDPNEQEKSKEKLILIQLPENFELDKLGEGHIGKIKVYKSGKIVMCVNNDNYLNVSLSVSGAFLQVIKIEII